MAKAGKPPQEDSTPASRGWFDEHRRWAFGLAFTAVVTVFGGGTFAVVYQDLTQRDERNAAQVRECMRQHGLGKARDTIAEDYDPPVEDASGSAVYDKRTFASCSWPRPSYADPDGYSEVVSITTDGPGDGEASDSNALDRLKTSGCTTIEVLYTYGSQGYSERQPPYIVELGDVISAYTGEAWTGENPYPYPERDEVVVVRNSKISLDSAHCVE